MIERIFLLLSCLIILFIYTCDLFQVKSENSWEEDQNTIDGNNTETAGDDDDKTETENISSDDDDDDDDDTAVVDSKNNSNDNSIGFWDESTWDNSVWY